MNLHVTGRAVRVLRVLIVLRTGGLDGAHVMSNTVAGQTQLIDRAVLQQAGVS